MWLEVADRLQASLERLSSISGTPSATVSFTYDFAGRRVSKSVNGTTTHYLYDGDLLIAEVNSAGQVQTADS